MPSGRVQAFTAWRCTRCGYTCDTAVPVAALGCVVCYEARGTFPPMRPRKRSRYGIAKTEPLACGRVYDSNLERRFRAELDLREKAGDVRNIREKEPVDLLVCTWRVDFVCEVPAPCNSWRRVRYETKGIETADYKLKRALYRLLGDCLLFVVKEEHGRRDVETIQPATDEAVRAELERFLERRRMQPRGTA